MSLPSSLGKKDFRDKPLDLTIVDEALHVHNIVYDEGEEIKLRPEGYRHFPDDNARLVWNMYGARPETYDRLRSTINDPDYWRAERAHWATLWSLLDLWNADHHNMPCRGLSKPDEMDAPAIDVVEYALSYKRLQVQKARVANG